MTDELTNKLRARARVWAQQVTKLAHGNLGKFRKLITVQSRVEEQGDKIGVRSTARGKTARAYEYGSGVHSRVAKKSPKQLGPKGRILIKPKSKKMLAFHWEIADKFPGPWVFGEDGKVLFYSVKHPGVEAANGGKGYLGPAMNEVRKQIRREIPKETRDAVIGTLRKSFKK